MTRDDAKAKIYGANKVGDVYFLETLIDEIYDEFEEDLLIAHENIDKAIDSLAEMTVFEFEGK